jgi:hypothetical protein
MLGGGSADITTCDNTERAKRDSEPERNTYEVNTVEVANEYQKVETLYVAVVCEHVSHNAGNISDKRFA